MSLRDAIESGNYQNYYSSQSKKKKKSLRDAIEDGTYENYYSSQKDDVVEENSSNIGTDLLSKFLKPGKEMEDGYQFGDVSKMLLGTGTDLIQKGTKPLLSKIEEKFDIGVNMVATGLNTGSGALGIKNEKLANDLRNFADKDLSSIASKAIANVNPVGMAYNIVNGTPQKILDPAGIMDKDKNILENLKDLGNLKNYGANFEKAWLTDKGEEEYEKSSVAGDFTRKLAESVGDVLSFKIHGEMLGNKATKFGTEKLGANISKGNIGIKLAGHELNLPTLAITGGMSSGLQEANSKENVSEVERWSKAFSGGIMEGFTESLFGLLGIGGNDITEKWATNAAKKFSSRAGKTLAMTGISASGEAVEEFLSYSGNFLIDNGIIDKLGKADFKSEWDWGEVGEQMALAFISSAITSGIGTKIGNNSAIKAAEEQLGRKLTNAEKGQVTQAMIDGTIQEKINDLNKYTENENKVYGALLDEKTNNRKLEIAKENEYNASLEKQQNMLARDLTEQEKVQLQKEIDEKFNNEEISLENIKLDEKEMQEFDKSVREEIEDGNITGERIRQILGEDVDISNDRRLQKSYIQSQNRSRIYDYQMTESVAKNAVMESAVKANMNNTDVSRNFIDYVSKVSEDTGVAYKFANTKQLKELGYAMNNKVVDGVVAKDGTVYINPQSKDAINYVLGHETTHLLENTEEYGKLQKMVMEYANQKGIYEDAMENIRQRYNNVLETDEEFMKELTSDLTSRILFSDETFIQDLSVKEPNIFKKFYNFIKHTFKMATAGSKEAKQLEKIKYSFDKAYKSLNKESLVSNERYHVSENFSNEIDKALKGEISSNNQVKARDYTPKVLVDNGVQDLPMLLTQKHIKSIIYSTQQAESLGLPTKNINYHGLGKELLVKAIDNLDNPQAIYKINENNYVVVTEFRDKNDKEIIVPIQINAQGRYNNVFIDENQIKSVYGRNNLSNYLKNNNFEEVYTKNKESDFNEGIQYSNVADSNIVQDTGSSTVARSTNSIPSQNSDVNTTNGYYMQETDRNSENSNNKKDRFSIQLDNNGDRYVKVDTDQDIFEGIDKKDYSKIARMYMQDYLEGKTKLTEDDSTNVGNKGINKYTNPLQNPQYMTEKMKLAPELRNVLEVAEKVSEGSPSKDTSKFPKWEYYKFNFELNGKNFEGLINIGIDKNGNKHFYEINKIQPASEQHISAILGYKKDLLNNSIAPQNTDVNTTNGYYMQELENNSKNSNNKKDRFSIQLDNNGDRYVKVDTDQDIFEGKTLKEQKDIAKQYILENFRDNGLLKENNLINISRKTANEYTNPKNINSRKQLVDKLKASTELDNLLEISEYVYSRNDDGRHIFAKNGWDYYKTTFQVGNKVYTGLLNIAKGDNTKLLYDITKIEETSPYSVKTVSMTSSSTNSIPSQNSDVNTTNGYYMQESEKNTDNKYSISGKKGMYNLVKNNPSNYIKLEQMYNKAQQLQKIGVDNETIRQQTNWFQDKNGDWKFEFSDKDMSLKSDIQLKENSTYKLGDILEHDTLFMAYPELANYNIIIKDSKVNGSFSKRNTTITLDTKIIENKKSVEGTLIHEIQHAIQNIENFEHGTSSKNSKLNYYNSLGEIEATDTKSRFLQEKYNSKDISNISPESSKALPQHKDLNSYLKNRNMFDRIKDSIYNYFNINNKGGRNNYEVNTEQNYTKSKGEKEEKIKKESFGKKYGIENYFNKNDVSNNESGKEINLQYNTLVDARRRIEELENNSGSFNLFDKIIPEGNNYKVTSEDVAVTATNKDIPIVENGEIKGSEEIKLRGKAVQYANKAKNRFIRQFTQDMKISENANKQLILDTLNQIQQEISKNGQISEKRTTDIYNYMYDNLLAEKGKYYSETVGQNFEVLDRENFDRNLQPLIKELKLADRYNKEEIRNNTTINDVGTLKEVYKQLSVKQKEYEKAMSKELLTQRDKAQVDRLINQEITIDELPADVNKEGILNVYNVKKDLVELKKDVQNYRKNVVSKNRELAKDMTKNILTWKDKSKGFKYQINTMKRNLRDIIPNKAEAQAMYDTYFRPITKSNALIEKNINLYNQRIEEFNINNKESTYIQMLGESTYNPDSKLPVNMVEDFYNKNKNKIDKEKCIKAVEEFRAIYDELIERTNTTLLENGYKPIEYRQGYFPHFIEDKADTVVGKMAEKMGWKIKKDTLPTDIAGITDTFKPGKSWTSFSQQRTGDATDYNALKGFDNYIRGAMDVIYHTENIQKLRALENEIRYQYSQEGIKEQIDSIYANNELDVNERQTQIDNLLDNIKNTPIGNFVTELKNYTNNLANKKATGDRGMEEFWGRENYSIMSNIQNRVSANMVGANIGSAITNFIPITQAWSQTSTKNIMRGLREAVSTCVKDDGFAYNSTFLTNRTKGADRLYKTGLDNVNDKLGFIFDKVDEFTSNVIVRAKYYDNIEKGMSVKDAMDNADEFAKDVIAGRSKGDMPTVFNKKNPLAKLFTSFQLEVNNQYGYMFKDIPSDLADEGKEKMVGAFIKMFLGAFFYNMASEQITGRKSAFSPIDIAIDSYRTATNEDMSSGDKVQAIGGDLVGELPFVGGIAGGGRLPIQAALPDVSETITSVSDLFDMNVEDKKSAINTLKQEMSKPLYYIALPFAGGQIKKTVEGLSMYKDDLPIAGSYTNSGKLRYTVDDDIGTKMQAAIFGQYSVKGAREYFDKGYSPLTEKQTQELVDLDIKMSDYRKYKQKLKEIDNIKKEDISDDSSKLQMKLDYIASLDIPNEKKNILANNATTRKDKIDVKKYEQYNNLEEMDYAIKNPTTYKVIKHITDFSTYNKYKDEISNIKKKYSTSEQKKRAVVDYINELPLDLGQKAIMIKLNYNGIKDNNQIIVEYVNNLDIDHTEKIEMFDKLGFKYKGGRIYE